MQSILDGQIAWSSRNTVMPAPVERLETAFADWQALTQANGTAAYRDAHCSAFTPASFELLLADLRYLGLTRFEVMEISGPNGCEFYVHLRNPSGYAYRLERPDFYRRARRHHEARRDRGGVPGRGIAGNEAAAPSAGAGGRSAASPAGGVPAISHFGPAT
jgi:hypothetical protein